MSCCLAIQKATGKAFGAFFYGPHSAKYSRKVLEMEPRAPMEELCAYYNECQMAVVVTLSSVQ